MAGLPSKLKVLQAILLDLHLYMVIKMLHLRWVGHEYLIHLNCRVNSTLRRRQRMKSRKLWTFYAKFYVEQKRLFPWLTKVLLIFLGNEEWLYCHSDSLPVMIIISYGMFHLDVIHFYYQPLSILDLWSFSHPYYALQHNNLLSICNLDRAWNYRD